MEVCYTLEFEKQYKKLSKFSKFKVKRTIKRIKHKFGKIGKPLAGLKFFREVRINGKRLYFLIYNTNLIILIVAISNKKTQQATINKILNELKNYKKYL